MAKEFILALGLIGFAGASVVIFPMAYHFVMMNINVKPGKRILLQLAAPIAPLLPQLWNERGNYHRRKFWLFALVFLSCWAAVFVARWAASAFSNLGHTQASRDIWVVDDRDRETTLMH
jgi:hypothetical protein